MKILSALILFFTLFGSTFSRAGDLQGKFSLIPDVTEVKEGDLVEGVLKVWPLENADLNEFRKYQNTTLFSFLYLTQIESLAPSENNADVIEMKALFIVKSSKDHSSSLFSYKGLVVNTQLPAIKVNALDKQGSDYFVMDQSLSYSYFQWLLIGSIFIIVLILLILKRESLKNFFKKFKYDPVAISTRKFNEIFTKAQKREEYEAIYASRKEWLQLVKVMAPAYQEFFKVMEQHQYKKNWGAEELSDVQSAFDVIRGSFK